MVIDLKAGKLTYQDVGQIDFYVRYFEDKVKLPEDNPTIGIVLCTDKNDTMAKYGSTVEKLTFVVVFPRTTCSKNLTHYGCK